MQCRKAQGQSHGKKGIDIRLILDHIPFPDSESGSSRFHVKRQELRDLVSRSILQVEKCSKIAQKISEDPFMNIQEIAQCTGLRRNTVSRCLKRMYTEKMLTGPWMSLEPHRNYKEYVYLMNFSDPSQVSEELQEFPHVVQCSSAFGQWNTLVITERLLDFSQLEGFESVMYCGVKGDTYTPRVRYSLWDESWRKIRENLVQFVPGTPECRNERLPSLNWGSNEWKLFSAFRANTRKKIVPVLHRINVQYRTYKRWIETLRNHCTIHTEFYPLGYENYTSYCLLLDSNFRSSVITLFSLFPTTPVIMKVGERSLVFVKIPSHATGNLISMINGMKEKGMIRNVKYAIEHEHEYAITIDSLEWR